MTLEELHITFLNSSGVSTDSRNIKENQIFFALKGELFDGNQYAQKAIDQGAKLVIIDDKNYQNEKTLVVDDVLKYLQDLAHFHRHYLNLTIIAITGSNGKTTTKNLIKEALSRQFRVKATEGNLNNHIGVPLTLLSFNSSLEIGIVEMGANHQGEIKALCKIADPSYGYITNFGKSHLEGFGGIEGVIKGKSELYDYLMRKNRKIFINADDPKQVEITKNAKTYRIGEGALADCRVKYINADPYIEVSFNGKQIQSQLLGSFNFKNISAAIGFGVYFSVQSLEIMEAIEGYSPQNMRSQIIEKDNFKILLDAYNANPTSMEAAILALDQMKAKEYGVILGDMFEVGNTSEKEHKKIIDLILSKNFDQLILVGEAFYELAQNNQKIKAFRTTKDLITQIDTFNFKDHTILIKGSRGMQLETLVDAL